MVNNRSDKSNGESGLLNTAPLYAQVRDIMIDRIRSQVWRPGQPLPNELLLANDFRVSIGTVRKAMEDLSSRGMVLRYQGRGTFVADGRNVVGASFIDQIQREDGSAIRWDPPHTSVTIEQAHAHEEKLFGSLTKPVSVLRFEWLLGAGGRHMALQKTSVPTELVEIDTAQAKHIDSLNELFDRARIYVDRTEITLNVAPADAGVADRLSVPLGTCLQHLRRRLFDLQGRAVAVSEDWLALKGEVFTYVQSRAQG